MFRLKWFFHSNQMVWVLCKYSNKIIWILDKETIEKHFTISGYNSSYFNDSLDICTPLRRDFRNDSFKACGWSIENLERFLLVESITGTSTLHFLHSCIHMSVLTIYCKCCILNLHSCIQRIIYERGILIK